MPNACFTRWPQPAAPPPPTAILDTFRTRVVLCLSPSDFGVMAPMARLVTWVGCLGHQKLLKTNFLMIFCKTTTSWAWGFEGRLFCVFCSFLQGQIVDPLAPAQSKPHFLLSPSPPKLWCVPYHFVHIPGTLGVEIGPKDYQNRAWKQYLGKSVFFWSGSVFGSFLEVLSTASACQWDALATKRSRLSCARGPGIARTLPFCHQSLSAGQPTSQPTNQLTNQE